MEDMEDMVNKQAQRGLLKSMKCVRTFESSEKV